MKEQFMTYCSITDIQYKRLKYLAISLTSEISKLSIIATYFLLFSSIKSFIMITIVLMSIRVWTGGLHFNKYSTCLAFSLLFYICTDISASIVITNTNTIMIIMITCLSIIVFQGPIQSNKRPLIKEEIKKRCTLYASITIIFYILLIVLNLIPKWENTVIWVIVYQTIQLIVAKGVSQNAK